MNPQDKLILRWGLAIVSVITLTVLAPFIAELSDAVIGYYE